MDELDAQLLQTIRDTAEQYNRALRKLVDIAAVLVPHDLASDFVYGVIDLERVKVEMKKEKTQ